MAKDIVIRGGEISEKSFAKKADEYTTQDVLTDLSVYVGKVDGIDSKHEKEIVEIAKGYTGSTISVVDKKHFPATAKFKKDTSTAKPCHHLLSGISIEDAVKIFKNNSKRFST